MPEQDKKPLTEAGQKASLCNKCDYCMEPLVAALEVARKAGLTP